MSPSLLSRYRIDDPLILFSGLDESMTSDDAQSNEGEEEIDPIRTVKQIEFSKNERRIE